MKIKSTGKQCMICTGVLLENEDSTEVNFKDLGSGYAHSRCAQFLFNRTVAEVKNLNVISSSLREMFNAIAYAAVAISNP